MHTMKLRTHVSGRLSYFQLKRLATITHRERSFVSLSRTWKTLAAQQRSRFLLHLTKISSKLPNLFRSIHDGAALVLDHISDEHADRRQRTRSSRRDDHRNPQRTGEVDSVQTTSAAERQECELPRVVSALDGNVSQRALHV